MPSRANQHRLLDCAQQHHITFPRRNSRLIHRFYRLPFLETTDASTAATCKVHIQQTCRSLPQRIQSLVPLIRLLIRFLPRKPRSNSCADELGYLDVWRSHDLCDTSLRCVGTARLRWPCGICTEAGMKSEREDYVPARTELVLRDMHTIQVRENDQTSCNMINSASCGSQSCSCWTVVIKHL